MINAVKIIREKTGLGSNSSALLYEMAKDKLRLYLNVPDSYDLKRFDTHLIEIACLIHEKDEAVKKAREEGGGYSPVSSDSFKEGPVSVSRTYKSSEQVKAEFEASIGSTLETLKGYKVATIPTVKRR